MEKDLAVSLLNYPIDFAVVAVVASAAVANGGQPVVMQIASQVGDSGVLRCERVIQQGDRRWAAWVMEGTINCAGGELAFRADLAARNDAGVDLGSQFREGGI